MCVLCAVCMLIHIYFDYCYVLDGSGGQFNPFTVSLGLFGLTATAGKQFILCISFGILLQTLMIPIQVLGSMPDL